MCTEELNRMHVLPRTTAAFGWSAWRYGQNLAHYIERSGFSLAVYDPTKPTSPPF
jgi:hypothetical protein